METILLNVLRIALALVAGCLIGYAFGLIQNAARLRHEKRQLEGKFKSGWSIIPGSGARVAYLLVALLLVQVICPLLFVEGTQWMVSGGVAAGYGWVLLQQLLRRRKELSA
jgi:uncharacterized BrkB/YihY/UPF0761 family membrane protein